MDRVEECGSTNRILQSVLPLGRKDTTPEPLGLNTPVDPGKDLACGNAVGLSRADDRLTSRLFQKSGRD